MRSPWVYVRDLNPGGSTRLVSTNSAGVDPNSESYGASISGDGRYVAFHSQATNLVAGTTGFRPRVYVRDLNVGGLTRLVSTDSTGIDANYDSVNPSISADGRYVAFTSDATNLVSNDTNGTHDVFLALAH